MQTLQTIMKLSRRHAFLILGVLLLLVASTLLLISRSSSSEDKQMKRVKFSHEFHVKEAGVACADCHGDAKTSTRASENLLAKMEACKTCHEEQTKSNCTYCHLNADSTNYAATPNPKRELKFSHQLHVDGQKVECETCHTNVDKSETVGEAVPAMTVCASCHNDVKAANHCESCHTNLAALRPVEHNRTDFVREHKQIARLNGASCGACHTQESCADCHNGSELVKVDVPGRDLTSQHSPRLSAIDRGQGMTVTKVHDLNFRFTHGIAAKGKAMECQTCHSSEQFCSTCHQAGGNVNQDAFKPTSHNDKAKFDPGPFPGMGGEHSRLAKRDIESCATCHAEEGNDPVCIRCHVDPDGVRGNNPKTHDPGFMLGEHGSWHTDPGANCYVCHTDMNARPGGVKGQKFCGYCHR